MMSRYGFDLRMIGLTHFLSNNYRKILKLLTLTTIIQCLFLTFLVTDMKKQNSELEKIRIEVEKLESLGIIKKEEKQ